MFRSRFCLVLSLLLTATLLLTSVHLRSLFAPKPVANRLQESRHRNPSRRLLTPARRSTLVARSSRREPTPAIPVTVVSAFPKIGVGLLPGRISRELSKPIAVQPFRDSQRQHQSPA